MRRVESEDETENVKESPEETESSLNGVESLFVYLCILFTEGSFHIKVGQKAVYTPKPSNFLEIHTIDTYDQD